MLLSLCLFPALSAMLPAYAAPPLPLAAPLLDLSSCPAVLPLPKFGGKITMGPDNRMYVTSALEHAVYRIDSSGVCMLYAQLTVPAPASSFTIGLTFDHLGHGYVVNSSNNGAVYKINNQGALPRTVQLLWDNATPGALLTAVSHDDGSNLYVSDEAGGRIFRIDDTTNNSTLDFTWASSLASNTTNDFHLLGGLSLPYDPATSSPTSTNLLGVPFGVVDTAIDSSGQHLFFVNHERGILGRIAIDSQTGDAVLAEELVSIAPFAAEGLFYDDVDDKIFLASVFSNPSNLDQVSLGHAVHVVDLLPLRNNMPSQLTAQLLSDAPGLGAATGLVVGWEDDELYILDSALGNFPGWTFATYVANFPVAPFAPNPGPPQNVEGPFGSLSNAVSRINLILLP